MERIYVIPLGDVRKVPSRKRSANAVRFVQAFLAKNMKGNIKLDKALNEKLWEKGMRSIPPRIKVRATKQEDGSILATLA
ncbi:MAG: 50S ribosomal protein L31e [Candidatus Hydrothermarchaeota archaeon]|jgi:large subunit ribosomal protein L31e|nr:50S ribosomal protein L31e [Candidatus Hydrothermarchaeota archaeon]